MLKNINYVAFDFETTGLNTEKDEPIQIGIIKFNRKFEIIEQFSSYVKPNNLADLTEIVEFITWIKLDSLKDAPTFDEIKKNLVGFFDEKSILIWHNIQFDIKFMERYLWSFPYLLKFDTYTYSRLFLHFEPSYSLEILSDKYWFKWKSHDAYADSLMSMELFKLIIKKNQKLLNKYPFLADLLLKSDSIWTKILELSPINRNIHTIPKKWLSIPKTKKIKSDTLNLTEFASKTVFNVNWINFSTAFNFALNWQNKVIFAFSSNARQNIAKNILRSKYIQFSTLNLWYTTNIENEKQLLTKEKLDDFEINYILKSFSHYSDDFSIFDISNFNEYKINRFLSGKNRKISANLILSTHYDLFNFIKENWKEQIQDYIVVMFDWHYWMNSLWKIINRWFDFYELMNKLDVLLYKEKYIKDTKHLELLINNIATFFGTLSLKLLPLFKWTNNKLEIVNLFENSSSWFFELKDSFFDITNKINKLNEREIINYWNIFKECVENYCIIEQKIFWQDAQLKYIFNPMMENIDINTFNDFMEGLNYYNFTVMQKNNYIKLSNKLKAQLKPIKFVDYNDQVDFNKLVETIRKQIETGNSLFLVSNNKMFSNSLFKLVYNLIKEYNLEANIYAENITGWQWKLLYYLQKTKWVKITIWWPEFLLSNHAKHIKYNEIHLLSIWWKFRKFIVDDLLSYLS